MRMRMPFGKFKDWPLEDVPKEYLDWLWNNIELREPLRGQIGWLLEDCGRVDRPEPRKPGEKLDVDGWFRRLSTEFHPDRGGSKEAMQAIERGRQLLKKMVSQE